MRKALGLARIEEDPLGRAARILDVGENPAARIVQVCTNGDVLCNLGRQAALYLVFLQPWAVDSIQCVDRAPGDELRPSKGGNFQQDSREL